MAYFKSLIKRSTSVPRAKPLLTLIKRSYSVNNTSSETPSEQPNEKEQIKQEPEKKDVSKSTLDIENAAKYCEEQVK